MTVLTPSPSSIFTRQNCLSHKEGLIVGNTDNIFYNYKTKKLMLVEYKSASSPQYLVKFGQFTMYKLLDTALKLTYNDDYYGTFTVWTDKYQLDEANIFKINGKEVTKEELIKFLNLTVRNIAINFNLSAINFNLSGKNIMIGMILNYTKKVTILKI